MHALKDGRFITIRSSIQRSDYGDEIDRFWIAAYLVGDHGDYEPDRDGFGREVALLQGHTVVAGYPGGEVGFGGDLDFRINDMSDHAGEACETLALEPEWIAECLGKALYELDTVAGLVFCEDLSVDREFRGNEIALMLLQEVRHVFRSSDMLLLLKAAPKERRNGKTDRRRLARYYASKTGFVLLEEETDDAWMISHSRHGWSSIDGQPPVPAGTPQRTDT